MKKIPKQVIKNKSYTIRLTESELKKIKKVAKYQKCTISHLIRFAVEDFMEGIK